MGRPKKDIDAGQVFELANIGCTNQEIAAVVGCSDKTVAKRFSDEIDKGREQGKKSLRRVMWDKAMGGNIVMLIWLSKQYLKMTDKSQADITTDGKPLLPGLSAEQYARLAAERGGPGD